MIGAPVVGLKCRLKVWHLDQVIATLVVPPVQSYGSGNTRRPWNVIRAETAARVVLTHALSPTRPIDLTDAAAARALVRELVLPGLLGSETVT